MHASPAARFLDASHPNARYAGTIPHPAKTPVALPPLDSPQWQSSWRAFAWGLRSITQTILTVVLFVTYLGIGLCDTRDTCESSSPFSSYAPARKQKPVNGSPSVASTATDLEAEAEHGAIQDEPPLDYREASQGH